MLAIGQQIRPDPIPFVGRDSWGDEKQPGDFHAGHDHQIGVAQPRDQGVRTALMLKLPQKSGW